MPSAEKMLSATAPQPLHVGPEKKGAVSMISLTSQQITLNLKVSLTLQHQYHVRRRNHFPVDTQLFAPLVFSSH